MKLGSHSDSVLLWKQQRALSLRDADTKRNLCGRKLFQRENLLSIIGAVHFSEGKLLRARVRMTERAPLSIQNVEPRL
jgi:hypothetical protein